MILHVAGDLKSAVFIRTGEGVFLVALLCVSELIVLQFHTEEKQGRGLQFLETQ
jgi:imidazoleglycerol phosphate synthase glutamine amidotransferase subunit HisH